jgi:lipid A 3-O-deacylase
MAAVLAIAQGAAAAEGERRERLPVRASLGVLAHDEGPTSDHHETGLDINGELQFRPPSWRVWQWIASPRPHIGATVNTAGDTSIAYAGVTYEGEVWRRVFVGLGLGLAIHDGPLHNPDDERCGRFSDCGFGSRVLFRGALEAGWRFQGGTSVSLFYEHFSHYGFLAEENEGVDSLGLRLGWTY